MIYDSRLFARVDHLEESGAALCLGPALLPQLASAEHWPYWKKLMTCLLRANGLTRVVLAAPCAPESTNHLNGGKDVGQLDQIEDTLDAKALLPILTSVDPDVAITLPNSARSAWNMLVKRFESAAVARIRNELDGYQWKHNDTPNAFLDRLERLRAEADEVGIRHGASFYEDKIESARLPSLLKHKVAEIQIARMGLPGRNFTDEESLQILLDSFRYVAANEYPRMQREDQKRNQGSHRGGHRGGQRRAIGL